MSTENLQNNLKFFLTEEVNQNKRVYKIIDGTNNLKDAHVFFKGTVTVASEKEMAEEMQLNYCSWYAKNRKKVNLFYKKA
ncbi:hypothetical protein [Tenacibaculum maritimum]|uniref:hypothetical protein n=1 Tax=Tenacibaculum maritimum TaxID=107401 RepID=UPI00387629EF